MEFDLSKPQQLLRDSARDFFTQECPVERVRHLMAAGSAFDADLWRGIAEQGWIGLHLPESVGGLGLGLVELAVIAEEMGRACLPGPFLASLWAATLLNELGGPHSTRHLELITSGELRATVALLEPDGSWDLADLQLHVAAHDRGYCLDGRKLWVLDAADTGLIVCVGSHQGELIILAVPTGAAGVTLTATPALDATRKLYRVDFAGTLVSAADVLARGERAHKVLESALRVGALVICAEQVGIAQKVLEMTVDYARTRQQFGRPIGAFQAVQHQCADILLATESARSAAYFAAWALSAGAPAAARAVAIAKAYCSDAATAVCQRGVQVHGGIGFTWEHDLHLYLKRAKANEALFGDATLHRAELARLLLDVGEEM